MIPALSGGAGAVLVWSLPTIAAYVAAKALHRRHPRAWTVPLVLTPAVMLIVVLALHGSYAEYLRGTHWLMLLLGPATVAFAIPVWEHRALLRRHAAALAVGMLVGSAVSMLTAWWLASWLGVGGELRLSLLPRSVSTPFAMTVADDIGGVPNLAAVFVVFTGVLGASIGEALLRWLPLRSTLARGALFGMGAHGAGVAQAHRVGQEEGAVAGLVMVLVGALNVLAAPLLALALR
ncbi:murein hydrolase effector protein LrgB [Rubrivivax gelatinosus]|uniref:LrgB family protein n=1 Tax=Rubrivivax gelatinosus TaxID=28068 RepID=UPI00190771A1|nr:murein hydrolase effector protein LrgB [Rubrivivax gelatinosus]MBZ8141105.1 murein hydrolase effector protein LrgB [Rubrivivax gelatinosus]